MHTFISAAILFSVFAFVRGLLITLLKTYNAQKANPMLKTSSSSSKFESNLSGQVGGAGAVVQR